MKKRILLIIIVILANKHNVPAQVTKGNWMFGGNINFSSTSYNSENYGVPHSSYVIQIKPSVGYFLINKLAVGINLSVSSSGNKGGGTNYTDFNLGPFLRYYLLDPEKRINIITEGSYMYGFETGTASQKASKNSFALSAGPVVYVNDVVGLEFLISYRSYRFSNVPGSNNTIMVGLGLQVHLEREK